MIIDLLFIFSCFSIYYLPIFACLIHSIKREKNKVLGIYLGYHYALFSLTFLTTFVSSIYYSELFCVVYFILYIGLTVILHSIRADRGSLV